MIRNIFHDPYIITGFVYTKDGSICKPITPFLGFVSMFYLDFCMKTIYNTFSQHITILLHIIFRRNPSVPLVDLLPSL